LTAVFSVSDKTKKCVLHKTYEDASKAREHAAELQKMYRDGVKVVSGPIEQYEKIKRQMK